MTTEPPGQDWADLWLLDLGGPLADAPDRLSPSEVARAARFASRQQADEFLASRSGLRRILSEYGADARGEFLLERNGKPSMPGAPCFSLSRTRGAALVAVSSSPVGADIERLRPVQLSEPKILEICEHLLIAPLQAWTAVEAWVKHTGQKLQWFLEDDAAVRNMLGDLDSERVTLTFPNSPAGLVGAICIRACSQVRYVEAGRLPGLMSWPADDRGGQRARESLSGE